MSLSDGIQFIDMTFAEGSPFPPRAFNSFAQRSAEWSATFDREHLDNGVHFAEPLAHAGGIWTWTGSTLVTEGAEFMALSRVGLGLYKATLSFPMRSPQEWGLIGWTIGSGGPTVGVEHSAPSTLDKTNTISYFRFRTAGADSAEYDPGRFIIHAFGRRVRPA